MRLMITLKTAGAQRLFDHPVIYRKNFIFLSFAENEGLCDSRFRFLLLSLLLFFLSLVTGLLLQVLLLLHQQ